MLNENRVVLHDGGGSSQSIVVRHGKGVPDAASFRKTGTLLERTSCQHAGSHVLLKKTAYNIGIMSHAQFTMCQENCGLCYSGAKN